MIGGSYLGWSQIATAGQAPKALKCIIPAVVPLDGYTGEVYPGGIYAQGMVKRGEGGAIVNVSSQASMVALAEHTSYCVSKGGVDQLTRVMALELGPHNIRVNAVNPTVTLTDMAKLAWSDPAKSGPMLAKIPLGKFAQPGDVANTVAYLLSDQADMIHGAMIPIDGGFLAT